MITKDLHFLPCSLASFFLCLCIPSSFPSITSMAASPTQMAPVFQCVSCRQREGPRLLLGGPETS